MAGATPTICRSTSRPGTGCASHAARSAGAVIRKPSSFSRAAARWCLRRLSPTCRSPTNAICAAKSAAARNSSMSPAPGGATCRSRVSKRLRKRSSRSCRWWSSTARATRYSTRTSRPCSQRVAEHRCDIKIQHNGTLLTDRVLDLIFRQHGTIMLSLDAIGPKFDEVRRGGVWSKAESGLERLFAERDPAKLEVGVYPTLTRRTKDEAVRILDWAAQRGANIVAFHRYAPIANSFEEAPTSAEYEQVRDSLRRWCAQNGDAMGVLFESESMNLNTPRAVRTEYASAEKAADMADFVGPLFPTEPMDPSGDPYLICSAPRNYVEIGLDGQIAACCRAQDTTLGLATSPQHFADAWLGQNYARLRKSLARGETTPYPLPNCEGCVKFFAPQSAGQPPLGRLQQRRGMACEGSSRQRSRGDPAGDAPPRSGPCVHRRSAARRQHLRVRALRRRSGARPGRELSRGYTARRIGPVPYRPESRLLLQLRWIVAAAKQATVFAAPARRMSAPVSGDECASG